MTHNAVLEKIFNRIEMNEEEMIGSLQNLVRIPSLVGQETKAQDYMETLYRQIGLTIDRFEADRDTICRHPAYVDIPGSYENRPNIVGVHKGNSDGNSLILNGHVDVVSPEPVDQWTFDPWGAEIHEGKLYGRGAVDMKSGVIANFYAVKAVFECGIKPKGSLFLQSVIEEEAGGSGGTLACFMRGYTADGLLISEPIPLSVAISHPGIKYFRVRAVGKTAHAALSHTGVNVIGKMNKIYDALIALDEQRAAKHRYPLVEGLYGRSCNLNIGTYTAGDWASTVAGMAQMECRIGFVPGEDGNVVMREVEDTIQHVADNDPWLKEHPPSVEWYGWDAAPWLQDRDHPFILSFLKSSAPILGGPPAVVGITGGLDNRFGAYFDTPSFAFGPSGEQMHGIDEYVDLSTIPVLTKAIAKFVLDWCGYE